MNNMLTINGKIFEIGTLETEGGRSSRGIRLEKNDGETIELTGLTEDECREFAKLLGAVVSMTIEGPCKHPKAECVYASSDGEFERWSCPDCGERWGVEIAQ